MKGSECEICGGPGMLRMHSVLSYQQVEALRIDEDTCRDTIKSIYCSCNRGLMLRERDAVWEGKFRSRSAASRLGWRRRGAQ
jgi:hypothetical protein